MVDQPAILQVEFGPSQVYDAVSDIRLYNATLASEIPSFVLSEQYAGGSVSSATLLFFTSLGPSSSSNLTLYYGNLTAQIPDYRFSQPITTFSQGPVSFESTPARPGSDQFTLTFGSTFSESFQSKVFLSSQQSYGSSEISSAAYQNDSGWSLVGNDTNPSVQVASDSVTADGIQLTRAVLAYNDSATIMTVESSLDSALLSGSSYTELVNSSSLASLGPTVSNYDSLSGTYSTTVASTTVGLVPSVTPSGFDVGSSPTVVSDAQSDTFLSRTYGAGPVSGVFAWQAGSLQPGSPKTLSLGWSVGSNLSQAVTNVGNLQPLQTMIGPEEVRDTFLPTAEVVWGASIDLNNETIGSDGMQIPLTLNGGTWLPSTVRVQGDVSYAAPGSSLAQSTSGWSTFSGSTGNSTATASTTFYSLEMGGNVARLSIHSPSVNGTAYTGLASSAYTIEGSTAPRLVISYRASLGTTQGLASNQTFYAAIDISNSFNGAISDTLYFPVAGSSPATDPLACGASRLAAPLPSNTTSVVDGGSLIADGTWRVLNVSLSQWGAESGFQARIRFCEATSNSFAGDAELLVSRAEVIAGGVAQGVLIGGLSYSEPLLTLSLASSTNAPPPVMLNGVLSFMFVTTIPSYSANGTAFSGTVTSPKVLVNSSRDIPSTLFVTIAPMALVLQTGYAGWERGFSINGVPAEAANGTGLIYSDNLGIPARPGNVTSALSYSAGFLGSPLTVNLRDANGNPVQGATLEFNPSSLSATTNSSGDAEAVLLNGTYQAVATFDGNEVGSSYVFNGTSTLVINATIYQINVGVTDAFHHAIAGAQVEASFDNYTHQGFTNSHGIFSFQAVANVVYHLSVSVGDTQLYSGTIKTTPNNAVIQIPTTYYPMYITLVVVGTVAGVIVAITLVVYFAKWRRPGEKSEIGHSSNEVISP